MPTGKTIRTIAWAVALFLVGSLALPGESVAKSRQDIDKGIDEALARFTKVKGSAEFLKAAKGVLVFSGVWKAGVGVGGEYGEGALRVDGKSVDYYSIASASVGIQFGAQKKDVIILFMQESALSKFRASEGWRVGVDGSVVLVDIGAQASIDTTRLNQPVVGFVLGQKGLMYNLTLEGSKITKIAR